MKLTNNNSKKIGNYIYIWNIGQINIDKIIIKLNYNSSTLLFNNIRLTTNDNYSEIILTNTIHINDYLIVKTSSKIDYIDINIPILKPFFINEMNGYLTYLNDKYIYDIYINSLTSNKIYPLIILDDVIYNTELKIDINNHSLISSHNYEDIVFFNNPINNNIYDNNIHQLYLTYSLKDYTYDIDKLNNIHLFLLSDIQIKNITQKEDEYYLGKPYEYLLEEDIYYLYFEGTFIHNPLYTYIYLFNRCKISVDNNNIYFRYKINNNDIFESSGKKVKYINDYLELKLDYNHITDKFAFYVIKMDNKIKIWVKIKKDKYVWSRWIFFCSIDEYIKYIVDIKYIHHTIRDIYQKNKLLLLDNIWVENINGHKNLMNHNVILLNEPILELEYNPENEYFINDFIFNPINKYLQDENDIYMYKKPIFNNIIIKKYNYLLILLLVLLIIIIFVYYIR
jgi:hypothetical protein